MTFLGIALLLGSVWAGFVGGSIKVDSGYKPSAFAWAIGHVAICFSASLGFAYLSFRCFGGEL